MKRCVRNVSLFLILADVNIITFVFFVSFLLPQAVYLSKRRFVRGSKSVKSFSGIQEDLFFLKIPDSELIMPRVSVLMSVYNREKTVAHAIDSILAQTFEDFEFIICDDGSSDGSLQILKDYAQKDSRIVIICNEKNLGLPASLNRCLEVAKGEYVARMDDDDFSYPERFKIQVDFLDNHPEYVVLGTGRKTVDDEGVWGEFSQACERSKVDVFVGRNFSHPTIMARRDALLEVGGYTVSPWTRKGQDYDLWCKIYERGYKGYEIADVLFDYYERRRVILNNSIKVRLGSFITTLKHRRKLGLPFYYDCYAVAKLFRYFVPHFIIRKHMIKSRKGSLK